MDALHHAFIRLLLNEAGTVLSVSDGMASLLGFPANDFLGGKIRLENLFHADDLDIAETLFRKHSANSGVFNLRLRQANGRIRCVHLSYEKTPDAASGAVVLELHLQDAKNLHLNQATPPMMTNFIAMMENTDDYIYFKDRNHVFTGASQTLVALTSPAEHWTDLLGQTDYDVFPEEYADIYYRLEKMVFAGIPVAHEIQETLGKDGTPGWVDNRKYPIRDENGEIIGLFGIARDISERIRNEKSLALQARRAEALLELPKAAEQLSETQFMQRGQELAEDLTGSEISFIHFVNDDEQTIELVTWSRRTLEKYCHASYDTHYPVSQAGIWADALRSRKPVVFNDYASYANKRGLPEGHSPLNRLISIPVIENGKVVMLTGVGNKAEAYNDIDVETVQLISNDIWRIVQRRHTQNRAARFSRIIEQSLNEIYIFDSESLRFIDANLGARKNLGYSLEELQQLSVLDLATELSAESFAALIEPVRSGQDKHIEFSSINRRKDGSTYPVEVHLEQTDDQPPLFFAVVLDITERRLADNRIKRTNSLYAALSHCNEAIVRCATEQELFQKICQSTVEFGGMQMAWIGFVDAATQRVLPVASFGKGTEYLADIQISVAPGNPNSHGPTGTAIRENRPFWCQDWLHDPATAKWHERGKKYGFASSACLPLLREGLPVGGLTLYADTLNAFDEPARNLLLEMAMDVGFALDNFARDTQRKKMEAGLIESEQRFRSLVEQSIAGAYIIQNGKFAYVNPRLEEILGYPPGDSLLGRDPLSIVAAKDRPAVEKYFRMLHDGATHSANFVFSALCKNGSTVEVGLNSSMASYQQGPAIIGLMQDISDRRVAEEQIKRYNAQLQTAFMQTVGLATTLSEMRDPYTAGHEKRVADLAVAIGTEMGLDAHRLEGLRVGGYLHDVGKTAVPLEILSKPGKLNSIEYEMIKWHAKAGYDVLKDVDFPWPVALIALQHHERMDGCGYPNGLKGEEIPLEARIIMVADVIEAMASHRPYRAGLGIEKALAEITLGSGSSYDPAVVNACLRLFTEKRYELPS